jgi:hypothetical protein
VHRLLFTFGFVAIHADEAGGDIFILVRGELHVMDTNQEHAVFKVPEGTVFGEASVLKHIEVRVVGKVVRVGFCRLIRVGVNAMLLLLKAAWSHERPPILLAPCILHPLCPPLRVCLASDVPRVFGVQRLAPYCALYRLARIRYGLHVAVFCATPALLG